MKGSVWHISASQKWMAAALWLHSGMALKDREIRKISVDRSESNASGLPLCVKGDVAQGKNVHRFLDSGQ